MDLKTVQLASVIVLFLAFSGLAQPASSGESLRAFQERAAKFDAVISLPQFETTSNAVRAAVRDTVAGGNAALDKLAALDPRNVTFSDTVGALDNLGFQASLTDNRLTLLKETSTDPVIRETATDGLKELEEWLVGLDYREDVYKVVKSYADKKPRLKGEEAKLLAETMRDYRRAGLGLPKAQRDEVEKMR